MKKLVLAIAMALSFVLPAFTITTVSAAEVSENKELAAAVKYWTENCCLGVCKGFTLASGKEVSAVKQAQIMKMADNFAKKMLIPCLQRNNLTAEWIKCQNDPEIRALNAKASQWKNIQDLQATMVAAIQLTQKKYPNFLMKITQDQEYIKGYQELTMKSQQLLLAE